MKAQKFIITAILFIGSHSVLWAQDYTLSEKSQRINDTKYDGFSIVIKAPIIKVEEHLYSYLKSTSKIRRKRNHYSIAEFSMGKMELDSTILYLKLTNKDSETIVWMGIKTFGLEESRVKEINAAINQELVVMARSYYVHQQELKIIQAETAAQIISKQQQALINENLSLSQELKSAEERKIELDNLLEQNRMNISVLKQKLIDNKFNQDSTYIDLQKVNRVIDGQKQKLKEID